MLRFCVIDPLEKVFFDAAPQCERRVFSGFQNEQIFLQFAVCGDESLNRRVCCIEIESELKEHTLTRSIQNVPVLLPTLPGADDNYLRTAPGLYPDLLVNPYPGRPEAELTLLNGLWQSVMLEITPNSLPAGVYPLTLSLKAADGETLCKAEAEVQILAALLPEQTLIRTHWFHSDCLADYYRVPVFSERYWELVENYLRAAVKRGCNMLLTPLFTPPLDTAVGGERTTVQLVDVVCEENGYRFGFDNLRRFVRTAQRIGIRYFEMSHLFTQWGVKHTPKIMATKNGSFVRIFGWETAACCDEYAAFLRAFLPALIDTLRALGIFECSYFHISDEPSPSMLDDYRAARALVAPYIAGRPIIDALSSFTLYEQGVVSHPIPGLDHLVPFLEAGVPDLWTYYCVSQYKDVSNAFIAMPGARTRMLGVQLYQYDIHGFLHWGYNFYNAPLSIHPVNPYLSTDAGGSLPSGDPFIVYPGADGQPQESLRALYIHMAMQDLRALRRMEALCGRAAVLALIEDVSGGLTLTEYPRDPAFFTRLRARVDAAILEKT